MRIKLLYIIGFLSIVATSCDSDKDPNLDFVQTIFCTPTDPAKCLPLEITNTTDGWEARYIGSNSKDKILLRPRYFINEFGDSTVTFDEYIEGTYKGSYSFGPISQGELSNPYHEVIYNNAKGKETASFFASVICNGDIFINNKDVEKSFVELKKHDDNDPVGCGSQRRDLNFSYLLHTNPNTLSYRFNNDNEFETITSSDGMFRIYKYYCWTGGNGFGSSSDELIAQYNTKKGIVTLDDFSSILYLRMKDFKGANFPNCNRLAITQATLNGKTHYLIEAVYTDPCPMPFVEGNDDYFKTDNLVLFSYTLEKGKLVSSNILDGSSMIELVNMGCDERNRFFYDDKTKVLKIPLMDSRNHTFTGKYREIKVK